MDPDLDPEAPPPSYEEAMNDGAPPPLPSYARASIGTEMRPGRSSSSTALFNLPLAQDFRAHQIIGLYRVSYSDYVLARSAEDPNPHVYITTHAYTRPQVELHRTGDVNSPVVATADFHTFSNRITISIPRTSMMETVEKERPLWDTHSLHLVHPTSGRRELFEWRHSSGPQVAALNGKTRGLKLVRTTTNEVIAVYTGSMSIRKVGKMRWLSNISYGDVGELIVLTSLVALVEKDRRESGGGGI